MMHIKEVIEKMKGDLKEETSYKVVIQGNIFEGIEEIEGYAPIIVPRIAETLGRCIAKGTNEGRIEDAFDAVDLWIREAAKKEIMANEKKNLHTDNSDSDILG